jgi:DHA1 family inner membrane transport protein
MAAVHNQAKRSACTLRFHVATEGAWDVGCGSGCLVAALLSALGVSLSVAMLLSLLGAVALFVLLRRYYASHPAETMVAAPDPLAQNAIVNLGESTEG